MFPMKSKRSQSGLNFSQPTDAGRESSGRSGKEGTPLSAWEKWERLKEKWPRNDKSAEQQGQVPPVSACSLMWNSCRQGLTSCVLTHETHFRDDGSTSTLPVAFLMLTAGEMKLLTIKHLLLPHILRRTLFMQLLLLSVSLTYRVPVPLLHHQKHKPSSLRVY